MDPFAAFPPIAVAFIVYTSRIADVTIGTVRTLFVVQGRVPIAMLLGFFEVIFWVTAITQVLSRLDDAPYMVVFYAAGFATGNAVGIWLERRLALGRTALRLVTAVRDAVLSAVMPFGNVLMSVAGEGPAGGRDLLYVTCARRELPALISAAQSVDANLFYVVERFAEMSRLTPLPPTTGWRGVMKKK